MAKKSRVDRVDNGRFRVSRSGERGGSLSRALRDAEARERERRGDAIDTFLQRTEWRRRRTGSGSGGRADDIRERVQRAPVGTVSRGIGGNVSGRLLLSQKDRVSPRLRSARNRDGERETRRRLARQSEQVRHARERLEADRRHDVDRRDEKDGTCKDRPDPNKRRRSGSGVKRHFVPWCGA